jgi:hypothetical protein
MWRVIRGCRRRFGPYIRFGAGIPTVGPARDALSELLDRVVHSAADQLDGDLSEPSFDEVEPRGSGLGSPTGVRRRTLQAGKSPSNEASTASNNGAASATCYDEYALTYLGGVLLACAVIHSGVGTKNRETRPRLTEPSPWLCRTATRLASCLSFGVVLISGGGTVPDAGMRSRFGGVCPGSRGVGNPLEPHGFRGLHTGPYPPGSLLASRLSAQPMRSLQFVVLFRICRVS